MIFFYIIFIMQLHYVNPVFDRIALQNMTHINLISSTYQIVYYQAKQTLYCFAQIISGHLLIMKVLKNKMNIFFSFFVIDFLINDFKNFENINYEMCILFNNYVLIVFFLSTRYCLSYVAIFKRGKR